MSQQNLNLTQRMQQAQHLARNGQVKQAEDCYRTMLKQQPDYHPAWHAWGLLSFNAGNLKFSVELMSKAVQLKPKAGLYLRNLTELNRRLGQLTQAIEHGTEVCQLSPEDVDSHYNLGLAYTDNKDYSYAIESYNCALKLNPEHGLSWNNLGSALEQQGEKHSAETAYAKAVAINPQHAEAQNNLGALYSERGKINEAKQCFEAAIAARPNFVEAHHNLSSLKTYSQDDPHFTALQDLHKNRNQLSQSVRIRYCFAFGKALDDIGEYEKAFASYQEGNQLQHQLLPVNEDKEDQLLHDIIRTFDADFFKQRCRWQKKKDKQRTPIFIVGMPRSGTSLLEQILSSHGSVYGAGELVDLSQVISQFTGTSQQQPFTDTVAGLTSTEMRKLGEAYLKRVWEYSPDSQFITDKMPANFFYIGLIHLALPHAKIIHAMRDPMDSCFSNYTRLFNDTMKFTYDQGTLGRYYVRYMKLMQHWQKVLPKGTILDLRYEDMVLETKQQAQRILDFAGLPWDENCLDFHNNDRHVKTASMAQVRKPIYNTSVARWKHFEHQLQPLLHIVKDYTDNKPLSVIAPTVTKITLNIQQAMTLAEQHQQAGRLQQAEELLTNILQSKGNYAPAIHLLGVIAHQVGKVGQGINLVEQSINIQPDTALYHSNLAEMYRREGAVDKAIKLGERAVALDPKREVAYRNLALAYADANHDKKAVENQQRAEQLEKNTHS